MNRGLLGFSDADSGTVLQTVIAVRIASLTATPGAGVYAADEQLALVVRKRAERSAILVWVTLPVSVSGGSYALYQVEIRRNGVALDLPSAGVRYDNGTEILNDTVALCFGDETAPGEAVYTIHHNTEGSTMVLSAGATLMAWEVAR